MFGGLDGVNLPTMKTCKQCGIEKPITEFPVADKRGIRRGNCRTCYNAYHRALYAKKRGEYKARSLRNADAIRERVFSHYGRSCRSCGESDIIVLTIDHIEDDGAVRRREGEPRGLAFYRWIGNNGFPDDLQVLCRNCNWRKFMRNVQRLSRKGVGPSGSKRGASLVDDDIV